MKKLLFPFVIAIGYQLLAISCLNAQTGTWTQVATNAPHDNMGVMILMTDGTVLCHNSVGQTYGTGWDKLTPNSSGSYVNGTWTTMASMTHDRLFFPTQMMPNGKVFAAGGEYGSGDTAGEVYDPVANTWTKTEEVTSKQNIYDGNSEILPDGRILVGVQDGLNPSYNNLYYTNKTNLWATAPSNVSPYDHDEAQWVKLPDSSILFVGIASTASVRYRPQTSTWVDDATVPVSLYDTYGEESGPGFLLPNGKAVFFGATKNNAIYTPTGTASPGSWASAATFPTIGGVQVGQTDASGCMMVNGHILLAVSPIGTSANDEFRNPVYFLEYNYSTNTFTQVTSTLPGIGADSIAGASCFLTNMLALPDGTVLFSLDQTTISNEYFVYTPGSAAIPQGKPTISSIIPDGCPNFKVTGKLFNGISEGGAYGDDWQMSTNYPLVRLTNGTNVYYCKTTNWNRIGAVQTDSAADTTVFAVPSTVPAGTYSLYVVVSGFASNPALFTVGASMTASISSVTGTSCGGNTGSATVSPSGGQPPYTYSWTPGGANTATASNLSAGTYTVTVSGNGGCSAVAIATITQTAGFTVTASTTANESCSGGTTGSVSSSVSGGTGAFTYSWAPSGGSNSTASGLSAGTYTVHVNNGGCTATASTAVTQPSSMTVSTSVTAVACNGGATGKATATVGGGTSPYTYSWAPTGGSTSSATGLSAGTYTVHITSHTGCTASATAAITQAAALHITTTYTAVTCNGAATGRATATVTGGTSPYTYSWSPAGGSRSTASALSAGTYTVHITSHAGCTGTAAVTITQAAAISITHTVTCNGSTGTATTTVSGGTSPYTYSWSPGGGTKSSATGLSAGTYTVHVTSHAGCTASASVTVTCPGTPDKLGNSDGAGAGCCADGSESVRLYPNPNSGEFTIQLAFANPDVSKEAGQLTSIEVYNMLGQRVYSSTISVPNSGVAAPLHINLSNEPAGIYLYRAVNSDGSLIGSGKVIIQK
jgi:hypothetical protein